MSSTTTDRIIGVSTNLAIKAPVTVATTANITLSGAQTIDGVAVTTGDRVLVCNQTTASENGIYDVATTAWSRARDFDGSRDVVTGTRVYVAQGATYAGYEFTLTTTGTITIGTTSLTFTALLIMDASASADVTTVAGAISDVSTVAGNITDVSTVAGISTEVSSLLAVAGFKFTFSSTTTMADPGAGTVRLNNATLASVTLIAFDATTADTGNPDISDLIATLDDATHTPSAFIVFRKSGTPATFAIYSVTGAVTDNTGWLQVAVTHIASGGTLSNADTLYASFSLAGDDGAGDLTAANNLSDVADAATAFGNIKQAATTSATGVVEQSTSAENVTGTSDTVFPSVAGTKEMIVEHGKAGVAGGVRNGAMTVTTAGTTGTFTADQVIVYSALDGSPKVLDSFSQAIDLSTTGEGGMDTGSATASNFVALYAIAQADGTQGIVACNVATSDATIYAGANMPTGYTHSALIGIWPTDGSSQFIVGAIKDRWFYSNLGTGVSGGTATSYTSVSLSSLIPAAAVEVMGNTGAVYSSAAGLGYIASESTGAIGLALTGTTVSGSTERTQWIIPILTAQTMYYKTSNAGTTITVSIYGYRI